MTELNYRTSYDRSREHRGARGRARRTVALLVALAITMTLVVVLLAHDRIADRHRAYLSTDGWPSVGQGAYRIGDNQPAASPDQRPVPIASVAKVMTAYLVLQHQPLEPTENGPTLTVTAADVADTEQRRRTDQSIIEVRAGERLTERQALMALLLPSANNVAVMLARHVSGSVKGFVAEMNRTARELGMSDTTYTDPSGFDTGTVSTAKDQLTLALTAARNDTLTEMMNTETYRLPVVGTVRNTNTLLYSDGFIGMKTGSDDAAGGCFMFRSLRMVDGEPTEIVGVVLGQRGNNLVEAGLYAAKQLVDSVTPEPIHP